MITPAHERQLNIPSCPHPSFIAHTGVHAHAHKHTHVYTHTQVRSYYLDLNLVGDYWGWYNSRSYHHTGMVS
jgi:hypothetical protein